MCCSPDTILKEWDDYEKSELLALNNCLVESAGIIDELVQDGNVDSEILSKTLYCIEEALSYLRKITALEID